LLKRRPGLLDAATEVLLDLSALTTDAQQAWLDFVAFACQAVGVTANIGRFIGAPRDARTDFAYLTGSAALSRKLLLNVAQIYIQPRAAPMRVDGYFFYKWLASGAIKSTGLSFQPASQMVTLISSVFQGDKYLDGFLRNAAMLQGYADCEHFLIRAASPGDEHARLVQHVSEHPGAVYLNLAEDPGLYQVWNLGVRLSTARYLSIANLDDRRAPEHLAYLRGVLNSIPAVDLASTALRISTRKNLDWADSSDCPVWFADVGDQVYAANGLFKHGPDGLTSRNLPHCMPMWRRRLHARVGDFDEKRYGPSADWAFWLLAGRSGVAVPFQQFAARFVFARRGFVLAQGSGEPSFRRAHCGGFRRFSSGDWISGCPNADATAEPRDFGRLINAACGGVFRRDRPFAECCCSWAQSRRQRDDTSPAGSSGAAVSRLWRFPVDGDSSMRTRRVVAESLSGSCLKHWWISSISLIRHGRVSTQCVLDATWNWPASTFTSVAANYRACCCWRCWLADMGSLLLSKPCCNRRMMRMPGRSGLPCSRSIDLSGH
jgi:hypothetical protein